VHHTESRTKDRKAMLTLSLIAWLICAMPVAVLIGYCALSEE